MKTQSKLYEKDKKKIRKNTDSYSERRREKEKYRYLFGVGEKMDRRWNEGNVKMRQSDIAFGNIIVTASCVVFVSNLKNTKLNLKHRQFSW